jgi:hypothetical protein
MTPALLRSVRRKWDARSQEPFLRLVRLFVGRVFHGSGESSRTPRAEREEIE